MSKVQVLLLVFSCLCMVTSAQNSELDVHPQRTKLLVPRFNITGPSPDDYECISARASDYYGIGVRLGIYFSWWTAWFANSGMPHEIGYAQDQNAVFLFANIIALVRCTITFVITQLDCLIMLHLSMGTILGVMSAWGYRTCHYTYEGPEQGIRHYGGLATLLRLTLGAGVSTFATWFWMSGIMPADKSLYHDSGPCAEVYTFMFGKINAAGQIRLFYIVMSIFWTIYFCIMIIVAPIAGWIRVRRVVELTRSQRFRTSHRLHVATGFSYRQLRYMFYFLRIFNLLFIAWSMVTVELTLNYNHVKSVLGPGDRIYFPSQLIPMIIGAFTLARILYRKLQNMRGTTMEPTVVAESPIGGNPQELSTGKNILKLFSPRTNPAQNPSAGPSGVRVSPEDSDIDPRMEGKSAWLRYLVSWLPWLSLLLESEKEDQVHQDQDLFPGPVQDIEAPTDSQQETLGGPADTIGMREKLFSWTLPGPDGYASTQAQSRRGPDRIGRKQQVVVA